MSFHRIGFVATGLMLSIGMLTGCGPGGPPVAPATGTVTYNGTAVEGANVTFISSTDPTAVGSGVTNAEGKFTIQTDGRPGAPIGKCNVGIAKGSMGAATMSAEEAKKATMSTPDPSKMKDAKAASELPKQYSTPTSSGLTADVKSGGGNDFKFDLTDGGGAAAAPAAPAAAPAEAAPAK